MRSNRKPFQFALFALTIAVGACAAPPVLFAQERDEEARYEEARYEEARYEEAREQYETLLERLQEIDAKLQETEAAGDEDALEELEAAGESIDARIAQLEREFGFDEDEEGEQYDEREDERDELERSRLRLEVERAEFEAHLVRLEQVSRLTEIADEPVVASAYAIAQVGESMEEDEAVDFLNAVLSETKAPTVRRLIRIKLFELYRHHDQPEQAREQLKKLILDQ